MNIWALWQNSKIIGLFERKDILVQCVAKHAHENHLEIPTVDDSIDGLVRFYLPRQDKDIEIAKAYEMSVNASYSLGVW